MRVHRGFAALPPEAVGCAVAIGNFDGVHLGHRAVIEAARGQATRAGGLGVVTFEPHPREVLSPATAPLRLAPLRRKIALLRDLGVDHLFLLRFDRALMAMPAPEFVERILVGRLGIRGLAAGEAFRFGHRRQGDAALLQEAAAAHDFAFAAVPPVMADGLPCSSTRIRAALAAGELALANRLLGYPFELTGIVRAGHQRGRTIGFPTANIAPPAERWALPAAGVYAVRAGRCTPAGKVWYPGIANLGRRPTFDGDRLLLEVHLLDVRLDLYGQRLDVAFLERLRGEVKFPGIEALKAQIVEDCSAARRIHERLRMNA
ncbi:MAG: bifunctional riboflavin kinase/FAD synthetase [Geminicoccaceae bacterium]